jgi:protein-L-isoaspartate(D-aspartate) O-methyltransferase
MPLFPGLIAIVAMSCARGAPAGGVEVPETARERMVAEQIEARGVKDERTLAAMRKVPRHLFVPEASMQDAYGDHPLPIGHGQTISQPYIVAFMTEALGLAGGEKVLEVGTGSGYQAAVLSRLARRVYTIERHKPLLKEAERRLAALRRHNVVTRHGDGSLGWKEQAPFDRIIVTAAAAEVPATLVDQLAVGGHLVIPIGPERGDQELFRITRTETGFEPHRLCAVRFVPLISGALPDASEPEGRRSAGS